jgi:hypothetical protein
MNYDVLSLYGYSSVLNIKQNNAHTYYEKYTRQHQTRSHYVFDIWESLLRVEFPVTVLCVHSDRRHAIKRWMKVGRIKMESYRNK